MVGLADASLPSGTDASGGFGTSRSNALSRASIGASCCSRALTSSLSPRSASMAASSQPGLGLDAVFLDESLEHRDISLQQVFVDDLADRLHHLDPRKRPGEVDLLALILDGRRPLDPLDQVND